MENENMRASPANGTNPAAVLGAASMFVAALIAPFVALAAPPAVATYAPPESIVEDGVPAISPALAEAAGRYTETRSALPTDWHPVKRAMLVSTRFGSTPQAHLVSAPGGARQQLTFFAEQAFNARFQPTDGNYMVLQKDIGGGEWFQLYRYEFASGDVTMLTDGKARNIAGPWSTKGDRIAYMSTRRSGDSSDLWVMDPANPKTDRMAVEFQGGGWQPDDWSPDDKKIVVIEYISINESYLWLVDPENGQKTALTPRGAEKISRSNARFARDGKGIYFTSDEGAEFHRIRYLDLATGKSRVVSPEVKWDVEEFELSYDGKTIAYLVNEDGASALFLFDTATGKARGAAANMPPGVISGLKWHRNNRDLAFGVASASMPGDSFSLDVTTGKVERWTTSESAVKTDNFRQPELAHWKSFDGRTISGFLYLPPASFPGKRPVLVNIHGGPEGQTRPGYIGTLNYYLNEMGIAVLRPNVRGSSGYGKTFLTLDNGFLREDSYKDIDALFDWIAKRPELDTTRVAVEGGSYGGHMVLAISTFYADRIKCSVDVVGMSNLVTFLEHTESYRRDLRRVEYGDEREPKMRAFLERIAPMNNLPKIKKPILVVAGKNDPRVPVSESEQIFAALKKQGTPAWYIMAKDEGHGFRKKANRDYDFFAEVEFLQEYLLK
jgi:dipeptidyl aminopeptidase/acylaminoacyl peptidase